MRSLIVRGTISLYREEVVPRDSVDALSPRGYWHVVEGTKVVTQWSLAIEEVSFVERRAEDTYQPGSVNMLAFGPLCFFLGSARAVGTKPLRVKATRKMALVMLTMVMMVMCW
jgi:hypothetical protein